MKLKLAQSLLIFISVLLAFALVEPFFRANLMRLPLRVQGNIEPCVRPLAQISKKGLFPHDYIAILGDSNAEGMGDWYISADRSKNVPFHSANIIHERTGRDVISLGSSGAAPQRYLVANLPATVMYINKMVRFSIERPADVLVYFYEGNDFSDSFRDLRHRFSPNLDPADIYNDEKMETYLRDVVQKKDLRYKRARNFHFVYNLQAANFVFRVFINIYKYFKDGARLPSHPQIAGVTNKIKLGSEIVPIPDGMHAPALELNDEQLWMGAHVFKKCLQYLMREFPDARYGIVYVPAPMSVYRWASEEVSLQAYEGDKKIFKSAMVYPYSDRICELIAGVAAELRVPFVDTRPRLRSEATRAVLHGPYDWKHLNRRGYELLSEDVLLLLEARAPSTLRKSAGKSAAPK